MNLFTFRRMEEDHFTNILMYILSTNNHSLLPLFIEEIIGDASNEFDYKNLEIDLFTKYSSREPMPFEYIIGIAPFSAIGGPDLLEDNLDSIPDAWIHGGNFTLLLEFKIRGTLDESQLVAHKKKLSDCKDIIRIQWNDVIDALEAIKSEANDLQRFLIEEFSTASLTFNKRRQSSGMPKQIIGGRNKSNMLHFVITGSKEIGHYFIDINYPDGVKTNLINELRGIQDARRWIAKYVFENYKELSLRSVDDETIISDFCVKPGRLKNSWNQWRLGSYHKQ